MPPAPSRTAVTTNHPGSSQQEIDDEPDWGFGHNHRIGYVNSDDRYPGFTHSNDENNEDYEEVKEAIEGSVADEQKKHEGELINFREVMQDKTDVHLQREEDHPPGFRFYVNVTEDWVKKEQPWPANKKAEEKKKQKEAEEKEKKGDKKGQQADDGKQDKPQGNDQKQDAPQKTQAEEKKQDAPQDKNGEEHSSGEKSEQNKKQDNTASAPTANAQDQQQSDSKPSKDTSSVNPKQADKPKKSQAASDAQAKIPSTTDEKHTKQRGQSHYWQNGDTDESDWRRKNDEGRPKHNAAFRRSQSQDSDEGYQSGDKSDSDQSKDDEEHKTEYQKLREKYSPEEIALLRHLQNEAKYAGGLEQNDGKQVSPVADSEQLIEIDVNDQFTPDNWIPRSTKLTRLTGKHPMNAEPPLTKLFEAGLITPNELHYVRNHGAVPRLYWETHTLDVEDGKLVLTMDEIASYPSVNIAVALGKSNPRKLINYLY